MVWQQWILAIFFVVCLAAAIFGDADGDEKPSPPGLLAVLTVALLLVVSI